MSMLPRQAGPWEGFSSLQRFTMYETAVVTEQQTPDGQYYSSLFVRVNVLLLCLFVQNLFIVGCDKSRSVFRILLLDRTSLYKLEILEDPYTYTTQQIIPRLRTLIDRGGHQLEHHFSFHALLGVLPLPKLHLILVTAKTKVGCIGSRWIYGIRDWIVFPIQQRAAIERDPRRGADTHRYKQLITDYIDLTKDFYFSYYYDLTHSLQHNIQTGEQQNGKHTEKDEEKGETKQQPLSSSPAEDPPIQLSVTVERDTDTTDTENGEFAATTARGAFLSPLSPSPSSSSLVKSVSIPVFPSPQFSSPRTDSMLAACVTETEALAPTNDHDPFTDLDSSFAAAAASPLPSTVETSPPSCSPPHPVSPASKLRGTLPVDPPRTHTYNEQFLWNLYLSHTFLVHLPNSSYWLCPVIHGFFAQKLLRYKHHDLIVTLIARRSRHFAGTRYIKRGINHSGHVANEVETEQIIEAIDNNKSTWFSTGSCFSSVLLLRGSIPLYWWQENVHTMKPNIVIDSDQEGYNPTQTHFDSLCTRYGPYIDVLSLIKKEERNPQEMRLGIAYTAAIGWIREKYAEDEETTGVKKRLEYQTYDFLTMRHSKANVLHDVRNLVQHAVEQIGVFSHVSVVSSAGLHNAYGNTRPVLSAADLLPRESRSIRSTAQHGIIRINCIDCLDRTNVAMFCVAKAAMKLQLTALGLLDASKQEKVFPELLQVMQHFFTEHGDRIAQQYAGSGAMHRDALYDRDPHGEEEDKDQNDLISGGLGETTRDRLDREAALTGNGSVSGSASASVPAGKGSGMAHNTISFVRRYYSNNVTDLEKQQAINVFLGHYIIATEGKKTPIWDIEVGTNMMDFDLILGERVGEFFYIPYAPSLLTDVLIKPRGSHVTKEQRSQFANHLSKRFRQFFDEKYNPTKLTSLDRELTKTYNKPTYIQQGQHTFVNTETYAGTRSAANSTGSHTLSPSPLISPVSSPVPIPALLNDEPESPSLPRSPSSSFTLSTNRVGIDSSTTQYCSPPPSPSTRERPQSRQSPFNEPSSPLELNSPRQQQPPLTSSKQPIDSGESFSLTTPVNSYILPASSSSSKASVVKAAQATKSFFAKGLKSTARALGVQREERDKGGAATSSSSSSSSSSSPSSLHRVRSSTNVSQQHLVPAHQPTLTSSKSQDFHVMDLSSHTNPDIHATAVSVSSPRKSNTRSSTSSALPPTHTGSSLPSSNSFVARSPAANQGQASTASSAAPAPLITAFDELLASAAPPPSYYSYESPHHQAHLRQQRAQQVREAQLWQAELEAQQERQTLSASSVSSPVHSEDELFQSYVNTERLCQTVVNDVPWSVEWQQQQQQQQRQRMNTPPIRITNNHQSTAPPLVTSTIPVDSTLIGNAIVNPSYFAADSSTQEVPGNSDQAALVKLAGEIPE